MEIAGIRKTCRVVEPIQVSVVKIEADRTDNQVARFAHYHAREVMGFPGHRVTRNPEDATKAVVFIYRD